MVKMQISEVLKLIPQLPQRQDSTVDQLRDLWAVANKLGLYDAADTIKLMSNPDQRNSF